MTGFIQIIEFRTSQPDAIKALADDLMEQRDAGTAARGTMTADRDRPGHYLHIVEFDSYESAMENSTRAETSEFAAKMAALCDGPARYYNLDVLETWESSGTGPSVTTMVAGAAAAAAGVAAVRAARSSGSEQESAGTGEAGVIPVAPVAPVAEAAYPGVLDDGDVVVSTDPSVVPENPGPRP